MLRARPWWHILIFSLLLASTFSGFGLYESLGWVPRINFLPTYVLYGCIAVILANATLFRRNAAQRAIGIFLGRDEPEWPDAPPISWWWVAAGFLFLATMMGLLERMQPTYFTHDDNIAQFLPVIVFGGRSLLSGAFPHWNPYQFMGTPAAASGIYALTYPPTYFGYLIARYVLRNEFLTLEVFVIGHLLLGYFATIWAARTMKVRTSIGVLAGLCCVLSGYALLSSRNWYYMSPVFVWVPLMAGGMWKLIDRPEMKWVVFLGVVGGIFFHAGNAQMWSYSLLLFGLACLILWLSGTVRFRQLVLIGSGFLLAVAIAAPLLIVQLYVTKGVLRPMLVTEGRILLKAASAFLLPGKWLGIAKVIDGAGGSPMAYSGTLFVGLAILLLLTFLPYKWSRQDFGRNVWIACAIAALLIGAGHDLPFWPWLLRVPGFNNFRLPFKFIGFMDIFLALGGALILERVLRHVRFAKFLEFGSFAGVAVLLAFNCTLARASFYEYNLKYSEPPLAIRSHLKPDSREVVRFLPIYPLRSRMTTFGRAYPLNLAGWYGLYSASGYDMLADLTPSFRNLATSLKDKPDEGLSELGVQYVLFSKLAEHPKMDPVDPNWLEKQIDVPASVLQVIKSEGEVVASDNDVALLKMPNPRPLAFVSDDPSRSLPIALNPSGALVDLPQLSRATNITVNIHCRRGFVAYADGKRVPDTCDTWERIAVNVPANTSRLAVRYRPPWLIGFAVGIMLAVCSILLAMFAMRHSQQRGLAPPARELEIVLPEQAAAIVR